MATNIYRLVFRWTEAIIVTSHLRFTAGVCVMAAGLLIGGAGGAIATAEPEAGGSSPSQGAGGSSQGGSANGTAKSAADNQTKTPQKTGQGETITTGSLEESNDPQAGTPTTEPQATDTEDDQEGSGSGGSDSTVPASDSNVDASDSAVPVSDSNVDASDSTVAATDSNVGAADSTAVAPVPAAVTPPTDPVAPLWTVVQPVTEAAATIANAVGTVPGTLAALPTSPTPVADVVTSIQNMLTSVTDAVAPLTHLPSDLYSLLGVPAADRAVIGGRIYGGGLLAGPDAGALLASPAWQLPLGPQFGTWGEPLVSDAAPLPTLGTIATTGLSQELSLSGMASLVPGGVSPGARSFFEHFISAIFVPASLSALAAVALPGVGGLLIVCAAGMRVGYRQAKAGFAMRLSGIARFAGPGPLGVVRTGSLIALHQRARGPRAARAVCPEASRPVRTLERVA